MSETNQLDISGMSCASCVGRVEKALKNVPGVVEASVNLATEKATIKFNNPKTLDLAIEAVQNAGYGATLKVEGKKEVEEKGDKEKTYLILSALLTLPLILPMLTGVMIPGSIQLILATPIQFFFGWRFYKGAYSALKNRSANMDVLVALGTSAAYFLSLYLMKGHGHHLYFESSAVVITLVMLGKYLEKKAKRQTTEAIRALEKLRPDQATILSEGKEILIPIEKVKTNDIVILKPGERIPVDGVIYQGSTEVDESMLTGESLPIFKKENDKVTAGAINLMGVIQIKTTAIGAETMLSRIIRLVEEAQMNKAPIQRLVDKISNIFVPVIIGISLLTLLGWGLYSGDWESAIIDAVAVLVIACPCALGLATPTSIMVGTGAAAKAGILIKDAEALEITHSITLVAFDKTGTLTEGKPVVSFYESLGADKKEMLSLIYSIQKGSHHPLAEATVNLGNELGVKTHVVTSNKLLPGKGVEATIDGVKYIIGNKSTLRDFQIFHEGYLDLAIEREELGESVSFLLDAVKKQVLGIISFKDKIKPESYLAIKDLKQAGIKSLMITGDNQGSAERVAKELGLDFFEAEVLPEEKSALIQKYKKQGEFVAMIGDGVNDAPALASADIGMAMSTGTDVAMHSASITLMRGNPLLIPDAIDISKKTYNKIKQNLFWAFIYNIIGIPLAALGYLSPMVAGLAMAMSSVSVVTNSLMLKNWKPLSGGKK